MRLIKLFVLTAARLMIGILRRFSWQVLLEIKLYMLSRWVPGSAAIRQAQNITP